ncbi:MAG: ribosome small subunit-dependent GTPase A [Armatimonadetes bacterium]|nr:ribosome small subunit-dependent GTPase A [Armatimonadota bacterium]
MADESAGAVRLAAEELSGLVVGSGRGGAYEVAVGDELLACSLRGRLKLATGGRLEQLAVGDEVTCRRSLDEPERGVIETVLPRRSQLGRGRPGKPPQIIAANLDQVMVVVAVAEPDLSLHAVDRFLAIAATASLPATIVLNKHDLEPTGEIAALVAEIYEPLGVVVLATSIVSGQGLESFAAALTGRVSVVIGPSGAGKSSLLNAVNPGYQLRTGEVMSIGKGRHTTTSSRLLPLDRGGYVADTPGIKTLQLIDGAVEPAGLQDLFPEIGSRSEGCRFADCTHRAEPDCAVQEAVELGEVAPSRYDSYLVLYGELEAGSRPW